MSTLTNSLKQRLRDGDEPLYGLWLSLGSDSAAEALAHAGYDWLCIDMEHAPNDSRDVASQLRAIAAAHLPSEPVVGGGGAAAGGGPGGAARPGVCGPRPRAGA
ncbi:aldolase/citrate lyase family protein, partial [Burkholderia cenocepacia]|uniref:aldolase/citrate lyase family protein n=1 Tax=Burkholderia cenocepacia TaxID=95486 RepID=UPI001F3D0DB0